MDMLRAVDLCQEAETGGRDWTLDRYLQQPEPLPIANPLWKLFVKFTKLDGIVREDLIERGDWKIVWDTWLAGWQERAKTSCR